MSALQIIDSLAGLTDEELRRVTREALRALEEREDGDSPSLETALLEGVRSEHRPYDAGTLEQVRRAAGVL